MPAFASVSYDVLAFPKPLIPVQFRVGAPTFQYGAILDAVFTMFLPVRGINLGDLPKGEGMRY